MNLFKVDASILEVVVRTAIVYFAITLGIRIFGKREIGQMAPNDLVLLLLISNAVQNAMVGSDSSVVGGIAAAATLLLLNLGVTILLTKSARFRKIVQGSASILIHDGKVVEANLNREKVSMTELEQALREHGVPTVVEVFLAVLELDGSISVLKKDEIPRATLPHHRIRYIKKA